MKTCQGCSTAICLLNPASLTLAGDVPIALAKNFRVYFVRIDQTLAACMIVVDLRIVITFITAILSDYHVAGFDDSSKPF